MSKYFTFLGVFIIDIQQNKDTRTTYKKMILEYVPEAQGRSHWGGQGAMPPLFHSQTKKGPTVSVSNIRDLLFTGVQKSYGPEISRFLPCMQQVLDNLRQLFIFSDYTAEIGQFTLDLLKRSDTYRWTFWRVFYCGPSKRRPQEFKR